MRFSKPTAVLTAVVIGGALLTCAAPASASTTVPPLNPQALAAAIAGLPDGEASGWAA